MTHCTSPRSGPQHGLNSEGSLFPVSDNRTFLFRPILSRVDRNISKRDWDLLVTFGWEPVPGGSVFPLLFLPLWDLCPLSAAGRLTLVSSPQPDLNGNEGFVLDPNGKGRVKQASEGYQMSLELSLSTHAAQIRLTSLMIYPPALERGWSVADPLSVTAGIHSLLGDPDRVRVKTRLTDRVTFL